MPNDAARCRVTLRRRVESGEEPEITCGPRRVP